MNFREAQTRLLAVLQDRIRNGDLTERGIARLTGISQPHIHNVLKRVRTLSPGVFDVILETFNLTLLDLCAEEELRAQLNWRSGLHPMVEMAVLKSAIGPKMPWPVGFSGRQRYPVPAAVKSPPNDLVLARLTPDERMSSLLSNYDLAILDISERART